MSGEAEEMRPLKDAEIDAMTRGLELFSPLTSTQRYRVLSWLSSRVRDMAEPAPKSLPGQLPMFDEPVRERPKNADDVVAQAAAATERAFSSPPDVVE